jgi:phage-related baseplate assembly protein
VTLKFDAIDLSRLAPPNAVEPLDFETIFAAQKAAFLAAWAIARAYDASLPAYDTLDLETDAVAICLQASSFRELLLRARVNDGYRATTLAYAVGPDLDHIGVDYGVARKTLDVGDPNAVPPVPEVLENDTDYRFRIQLAPEAITNAGTKGAYLFHGLAAHVDVLDAAVFGPEDGITGVDPGDVLVTIQPRADAEDPEALPAIVEAYLETRRPLTDTVTVELATEATFQVVAQISVGAGADAELVRQAAEDAVEAYLATRNYAGQLIGRPVYRDRLKAALFVEDDSGRSPVERVTLSQPAADVEPGSRQAAICTAITVTVVVE